MKPAIVLCRVFLNSIYLGERLHKIPLPDRCFLLGLARGNMWIPTDKDPVICELDWLIAVAVDPSLSPTLETCLKRSRPISRQQLHQYSARL